MRVRRASAFGPAAREYARHRPGYPDAAISWSLEPVRTRFPLRVLDLGAGTGRVTEALRRAEVDVIAVEPDPEMRAVMLERVAGVAVLAGAAEDIPLPDHRVDAVFAGQAFHWFDPEHALTEICRVLKPGGVLALLWNTEDVDVDWVVGYSDLLYEPLRGATENLPPTVVHPELTELEWGAFPNAHPRTVDSLLAMLGTFSSYLTLPETERGERLAAMRAFLESRPETSGGKFDLPMVTRVGRSIRR